MSRFEPASFPLTVWDGLYNTFNSLETDQYLNVDGKDRVTKEIQAVEQYLVSHAPTLSFFEHTTPARALVTVDDSETGLQYRTLANGSNVQISYVNDTIVIAATGGSTLACSYGLFLLGNAVGNTVNYSPALGVISADNSLISA